MDIKLEDILNDNINEIIKLLDKFNFSGCGAIASSLTNTFLVIKNPRGVFLSEFLEWLFDNLERADEHTQSEGAKRIKSEVVTFFIQLKELSIFDEKNDEKLMKKLIDIRYKVTKYQLIHP